MHHTIGDEEQNLIPQRDSQNLRSSLINYESIGTTPAHEQIFENLQSQHQELLVGNMSMD